MMVYHYQWTARGQKVIEDLLVLKDPTLPYFGMESILEAVRAPKKGVLGLRNYLPIFNMIMRLSTYYDIKNCSSV